jgi:pilus assembly protein CpaC
MIPPMGGIAGSFQDTRPGSAQALMLEVDRSIILKFNGLRRVAVVHPEVADVSVMSATELLVMAKAKPVRDQVHTMLYVWDRGGLHKFAVTVVGMPMAEQVAMDLRESLGPAMSVQAVSDTLVVVEGEVPDEDALENLETLLEASATEEVKVVSMVTTPDEADSAAARTAEALARILDDRLQVIAIGDDVLVVEGTVDSEAEAEQARDAISTLAGDELRVVERIAVAGQDIAEQTPVNQIRQVLGEGFTVTGLRGNLVAVDGTVTSAEELERVNRLLEAFGDQAQTINMVTVVPPRPDLDAARKAIQEALPEGVEVSKVGEEALMLEGSVPTEERLEGVQQVLGLFEGLPMVNLVNVVEPDRRRVLVAVKVMELSRGHNRELGIDWGQYGTGEQGAAFRPQPFLFGNIPNVGWEELYEFSAQVHALIDQQKAQILAEPNLLVNEDEEAEILIGGEIPVPIAQTGIGGAAAISVEWKPFGVNLKIKPTIGPEAEKVKLSVEPEVSSLDFANCVTVSGLTIPALRTRRTQTVVTVADGGVLAIGGLISSDQSKSVSKIPLLGDLPIIGQLFRHDTFRNDRSELIVLVLPQILGEDGEPLHPIPLPEGLSQEEVMQFGNRDIEEIERPE